MRIEAVHIGMKEPELRAALGAPYRVQLAGASMVYRWQDAYLEADADGMLRKIREKPSGASGVPPGHDFLVSMNCWRLTSAFVSACRDVQVSPRGELELPLAVQYAIDVLGLRIKVIPDESPVLDLSGREDIPRVALALSTSEVSL